MFRKLPGDPARDLVSTTPDTAVVFRPSVVQVPAIVTVLIALWRFLGGTVRTIYRHPIACLLCLGLAWLIYSVGWQRALLLILAETGLLIAWARLERASFCALVGWRLLAWYRWMWIYRRHWQPTMVISGLGRTSGGREFLPRLRKVTCDGWADTVRIKMLSGQSHEDWEKRAPHLAHAFGAPSCRVTVGKPGWLALTFPRRDPLAVPLPAIPIKNVPHPEFAETGLREDGKPLMLRVHGTHLLIVGATGAGKGSWEWGIIRDRLPLVRAGLCRLWVCDPKRMELKFGHSPSEAPGKTLFYRYAATPEDCLTLLEEAEKEMQRTADAFGGHVRKHVASLEYPHNIIIVDEVAFLTAYVDDRKIRDAINSRLSTLSTQGRSVGFTLIAALQDPRKEVLKIRNLFPDKIALRLDESDQVDMVLGEGARDRGALADLIASDEYEGAGVGFVRLEKSPIPIRGRAGYVSDDDITDMVRDYGQHLAEVI
ncbi:hypothetical cell division FtsK/SpoIIIE protein [Planobispora rosea]|uniref:Hypothetical cell division FtsK/SpoIIIE protein n=1 Tax=Planobispora rosea TaxID=35762 RepID=A0A8J3WG78_PLARO|nr:FtsK/SpoIIIE domain-containing protein [Planobispora rosea]GGT00123.1 hypothetical cell division FtsK/SpoIIIE protein [Planobispora rosea]GIH88143.1 hypothetical cell division FtsK/SpoIIIE protein [Planobispora rosea]